MLEELKKQVYEANVELFNKNLILYSWGNVSGIDGKHNLDVIKPSGVPYESMRVQDMVVVNFDVNTDVYYRKFKDANSDGKLFLLTSESKVPNPQELLTSEKFEHSMEQLRSRFDFIIIDCPLFR